MTEDEARATVGPLCLSAAVRDVPPHSPISPGSMDNHLLEKFAAHRQRFRLAANSVAGLLGEVICFSHRLGARRQLGQSHEQWVYKFGGGSAEATPTMKKSAGGKGAKPRREMASLAYPSRRASPDDRLVCT